MVPSAVGLRVRTVVREAMPQRALPPVGTYLQGLGWPHIPHGECTVARRKRIKVAEATLARDISTATVETPGTTDEERMECSARYARDRFIRLGVFKRRLEKAPAAPRAGRGATLVAVWLGRARCRARRVRMSDELQRAAV